MKSVSVTIITLNEERNIERCLQSVQWADEIVVVDSGSTDRTLDICREYNCNIIRTEWLGYARTKQLAVEAAAHDWVFSIDSDEEVTPELGDTIRKIVKGDRTIKGYRINRRSFYLGKMMRFSGLAKDYPLRLFLRDFGKFNQRAVHEEIEVDGAIGRINDVLLHYTIPTLVSHIRQIELYAELDALEKQQKGQKTDVVCAFVRASFEFFRIYLFLAGFLDGRHGLIYAANSAFSVYMKYLMLWERTTLPNKLY